MTDQERIDIGLMLLELKGLRGIVASAEEPIMSRCGGSYPLVLSPKKEYFLKVGGITFIIWKGVFSHIDILIDSNMIRKTIDTMPKYLTNQVFQEELELVYRDLQCQE